MQVDDLPHTRSKSKLEWLATDSEIELACTFMLGQFEEPLDQYFTWRKLA